ncbi:hypothetical protein [Methanospirillum hungatei]|uniref:hypothetical protein n=1 Tax=Methanospirillum hungatei TaxID=2203 RepID=UPI0026EECB90|nr:hypothetical protein [Methanospirillum hungatei]MCA1915784.1 hypothetical protein [Methanospirillum hungatei]
MDLVMNYILSYKEHYQINPDSIKKTTRVTKKTGTIQENSKNFSELRKLALSDKKAITQYVNEHTKDFSPEDAALIKRLEYVIIGRFILISVKKDSLTILYAAPNDMYLLQVIPRTSDAIEYFKLLPLPVIVDTALFPSDGRIIYDTLEVLNISIGSGMAKNLKADARAAKAMHGIITTLPIPIPKEDPDAVHLRGLMVNKESIIQNWNEILEIIAKKPILKTEYYQMLGNAYVRMRRKELKNNEIYGCFALYGWTIIAGGKTKTITEKAVQSLLSPDKLDRVVFFEVKK